MLRYYFLILLFSYKAGANLNIKYPHVQQQCSITDIDGKILRAYVGNGCLFYQNGDLVLAEPERLVLYDKNMKMKWVRSDVWMVHQIKKSIDGKNILLIASEYHNIKEKMVRFDQLLVLDLATGKTINEFSFYKSQKSFVTSDYKIIKSMRPNNWTTDRYLKKSFEKTHVNSMAEIPAAAREKFKQTVLEKAVYVAHCNRLFLTLYFDQNLNILPYRNYQYRHYVHDTNILSDGSLVRYMNLDSFGIKNSYIENIDPISLRQNWVYPKKDSDFYSEFCGGVQVFDDGSFFFSDNRDGAYAEWVGKNREKIKSLSFKKDFSSTQEARLDDFSQFLKNNRGQ